MSELHWCIAEGLLSKQRTPLWNFVYPSLTGTYTCLFLFKKVIQTFKKISNLFFSLLCLLFNSVTCTAFADLDCCSWNWSFLTIFMHLCFDQLKRQLVFFSPKWPQYLPILPLIIARMIDFILFVKTIQSYKESFIFS